MKNLINKRNLNFLKLSNFKIIWTSLILLLIYILYFIIRVFILYKINKTNTNFTLTSMNLFEFEQIYVLYFIIATLSGITFEKIKFFKQNNFTKFEIFINILVQQILFLILVNLINTLNFSFEHQKIVFWFEFKYFIYNFLTLLFLTNIVLNVILLFTKFKRENKFKFVLFILSLIIVVLLISFFTHFSYILSKTNLELSLFEQNLKPVIKNLSKLVYYKDKSFNYYIYAILMLILNICTLILTKNNIKKYEMYFKGE